MLNVYKKDDPDNPFRQSPGNTGYHKRYYSQPLPDGEIDNNTLEDIFGELETKWPAIMDRFRNDADANDCLEDIFAFIGLQRARVPAYRDAIESMLAEHVLATTKRLNEMGQLPPTPEGFDDLLDNIQVSIDPHQSIHIMAKMMPEMTRIFSRIGINIVRNLSGIPFLTSDNPVIWFSPASPDSQMQPYHVRPDGPVRLLFPVAPDLMIYGDTEMREQFAENGLEYQEFDEPKVAKAWNRQICRFAYQTVYAQEPGHEPLIKKYAALSPVLKAKPTKNKFGQLVITEFIFGKRKKKAKWKSNVD